MPLPCQGVLICVGGLGMLVASDKLSANRDLRAVNKVKGDLFMVAGATLYGSGERAAFRYRTTILRSCH
jgi:hypothetical protein